MNPLEGCSPKFAENVNLRIKKEAVCVFTDVILVKSKVKGQNVLCNASFSDIFIRRRADGIILLSDFFEAYIHETSRSSNVLRKFYLS